MTNGTPQPPQFEVSPSHEDLQERLQRIRKAFRNAIQTEIVGIGSSPGLSTEEQSAGMIQLAGEIAAFMEKGSLALKKFIETNQVVAAPEPSLSSLLPQAKEPGASPAHEPDSLESEEEAPELLYLIGDYQLNPRLVGITNERELSLLDIVVSLPDPVFVRRTIYDAGFMESATYSARDQAFPTIAASLSFKLQKAVGRPVIEHTGIKSQSKYTRLLAISKLPGKDEIKEPVAEIEKAVNPEPATEPPPPEIQDAPDLKAKPKAPVQTGRQPKMRRIPAGRVPPRPRLSSSQFVTIPPSPAQKQPARSELNILSDYLDDSALLDINEVWARLKPRAANEILKEHEIKVAIVSIMDNDEIFDYRTRVVIPVRTGLLPFKFAKQSIQVRRNGSIFSLKEVMQRVPSGQGVSLATASQLLGLKPVAVLRTEADFLKSNARTWPALAPLAAKLSGELRALETAAR